MKLEPGLGPQGEPTTASSPDPRYAGPARRCYLVRDQSAMFHNSLSQPVIFMPFRLAAKAEG